MEGVKLTFTEDALQVGRDPGDRPQDRRARPALDHGGDPARRPCSTCPGLDGVEEVVINREVAESRANPLFIYGKERAESGA